MAIFYLNSDKLSTGYPSLDWFSETDNGWLNNLMNGTSLHVLEMCVLFFSYYIHRHFPKEFSLSTEIMMNLISSWILNSVLDVAYAFKAN